MGNSARVIVTKAQRLDEVATIAIRRKNIERNKTAINAKQQTIRGEERTYIAASVGCTRNRSTANSQINGSLGERRSY